MKNIILSLKENLLNSISKDSKNFLKNVIIIILVAWLLFEKACNNDCVNNNTPTVEYKIDTFYKTKDSLIPIYIPKLITSIPPTGSKLDSLINYPDTNYNRLLDKYKEILTDHYSTRIYSDRIPLDSIGYVDIKDTLYGNKIIGRNTYYNYKLPIIKETTTITYPEDKKGALFVGGGIYGSKESLVNNVDLGLLYKTKKDKIFGAGVQLDINGKVSYGVKYYGKIFK